MLKQPIFAQIMKDRNQKNGILISTHKQKCLKTTNLSTAMDNKDQKMESWQVPTYINVLKHPIFAH